MPATEEDQGARLHRYRFPERSPRTLEQGQIDWGQTASLAKVRVVDPCQVTNRGIRDLATFNLAIEYQAAGMRRRQSEGRGRRSPRSRSRSGECAPEEDWPAGQVRDVEAN